MLYQKYFKRFFDFVLALSALIILSPLLLVIAVLVKLDSKGPVLFKQKRFGLNNSFFYIYKFRTMRSNTPKDTPTHLLKDPSLWITPLGKFLRKSSLDELPQLINILKGEMAIVGPRPALWNQTDLIELRTQNGSSTIRPGLTGWAQVNGRDELRIEAKAQYDGSYANHISLFFDLRCFFGTIISVLRRDGVVEGGTGAKANESNIFSSNSSADERLMK